MHDFRHAYLFAYDPVRHRFIQEDAVHPADLSLGKALILCGTGGFAYETERRMTASRRATLHLRVKGRERTMDFEEGINLLLPLASGELLVQTARVRRAARDRSLGDLTSEESGLLPGELQLERRGLAPDGSGETHLFHEDVVVDVAAARRVRSLRGPLSRSFLQDGRVISHSFAGEILELDPSTGHRQRIHQYTVNDDRWGVPVHVKAQGAAKYYVHGEHLYAVSAGPDLIHGPGPVLPPSSILRFDAAARAWTPLADFGFAATAFVLAGDEIVLAGPDRIAKFHIPTGQLRVAEHSFQGMEPVSIAAIDAGWVVALYGPVDKEQPVQADTQLWIVSPGGEKVLARHHIPRVGPVRLSTHRSPIHEW